VPARAIIGNGSTAENISKAPNKCAAHMIHALSQANKEPAATVLGVKQENIRRKGRVYVKIVLPVKYNQTRARVLVSIVLQVGLLIH
jgi:hypothetical protein